MDKPAFEVIVTDWATHQAELAAIRRAVFIDEQHVPESLEMDGEDARYVHAPAARRSAPGACCPRDRSGAWRWCAPGAAAG